MRNPDCKDCPLHEGAQTVCLWGTGPKQARVMIVGEAPGAEEDKTGKPFVGRSGQVLREELARVGIKPEECYITNTVKCRPPNNDKPKAGPIKACKKYLDAEIASVKPEYIITLGAVPTKQILKKAKITEVHGQVIDMGSFKGMACFHPAYTLYDPSKLPVLKRDFKRIANEINGKKQKALAKFSWRQATEKNLKDLFDDARACTEWFSFDLETSKLEWFHPYERWVSCLNIAFETSAGIKTWVVPMTMPFSPFKDVDVQKWIVRKLEKILRKKKGVGHNAKFDNHWLYRMYGVRFPLVFDTMLASHTIDENRSHGLDSLATLYLDAPFYDIPLPWKQGRFRPAERTRENVRKVYRYGARDAFYTLALRPLMDRELREDRLVNRLFWRLVMRASTAFQRIEQRGLYVLMDQFKQTKKNVTKQREEALKILNEMVAEETGGTRVNWNSPQQVANLFFQVLKLPIVERTAEGNPSTGEATLVALKDKHPIADQLVKYREIDKFLSTYLEGWKSLMYKGNVYFSYKLHGTVTGRYASRLHQTPRDGTIRNLISAPPGWVFVQGDFSQAELRVAAILSGDLELIHCFNSGIDAHWRTLMYMIRAGGVGEYVKPAIETAQKLTKRKRIDLMEALEILEQTHHDICIEIWKGWKEGRKKAKGINFGFVYGMMEKKFIETARLKYGFEPTEAEARQYRKAYFQLYRGLEPWHNKMKKLVKLDGYVRSLSGRLRRLPGIYSPDVKLRRECERQAINSPVQGFIGDYKAMALVELEEKLDPDRSFVVGEHHDAILFCVREDLVEEELPKIQSIMQNPELVKEFKIDLSVPIEVELEVGPWGKGVKWESKKH